MAASEDKQVPVLTAAQGRKLLLGAQGLLDDAPADSLEQRIRQLGFVQMDSINVVERAHHLILGSRVADYDPAGLDDLLDRRRLFEHWTHDAAAIPVAWYPHWKVRFSRSRERILASPWWRERVGDQVDSLLDQVLERVRREGPLRSADFERAGAGQDSAWWGWKPHKAALEMLWHTGQLAVAERRSFHKVYDLAERVFPELHAAPSSEPEAHLEWACSGALERLGVATARELAEFWDALDAQDAVRWCDAALAAGRIQRVALEGQDGSPLRSAFAPADWQRRLDALPEAPERIRILCPFDPVIRDRARCLRLFGFDYRFEAFVPQERRQYGYYVLPLLEGDRLVGRMDAKLHRDRGLLEVKGLWWERGVRPGKVRLRRLAAALDELAGRLGAQAWQGPPERP